MDMLRRPFYSRGMHWLDIGALIDVIMLFNKPDYGFLNALFPLSMEYQ